MPELLDVYIYIVFVIVTIPIIIIYFSVVARSRFQRLSLFGGLFT